MDIVRLYDINQIRSVMMHPDIVKTISDDTWDGSPFYPDIETEIFLGCVVDGQLIGVYRLHWFNGATLQGHAHILKDYRNHSADSLKQVMKWVLDNLNRCKKVVCFVPFVYPNVKQFLAVGGFDTEGELRNAHLHDNQLHNVWIMGISRLTMQEITNV